MLNEYCKEKLYTTSTLVEHTGRPFSVQKVYDLQALCTKIRVYQRIISVATKVKLLNHFQFHQLQLKTNKNSCTGGIDAQHRPLFDNAATRRRWGEGGGEHASPANDLQSHRPPSRPTGKPVDTT